MKQAWIAGISEYLQEHSAAIFVVYDHFGRITATNKAAEHLFGKPLAGLPLTDFFIDFQNRDASAFLNRNTSEKHLINLSTGAGLPETYYFRFYDTDEGTMALGESRKEDVERLQKSLLELSKEQGLLSRELHKKNAELGKLNNQKNEFLGIVAHDLRNPLGIIMGYSNFLMEELGENLSEEQIHMLKTIQGTSEFMLHLLNELLDIAAIESGKVKLDLQLTDIVSLIRANVSLNSVIASKKSIHIHVDCYEHISPVRVDRPKMEQVLNNLISNAMKYSLPGTQIRVKAFMSGDQVTIAVADQGQGIPEAEVNLLFKPFQRTSVKATSGEKSTGLGLSIVRNIVMSHHGKIWVESKVGVGTTFYFTLPSKEVNEVTK